MIEDVKNFPAELHVERLRDPVYRIVLEKREIEVVQARANHCVATGIPEQVRAINFT